ncbi:MAG: glycosyltransferase, partial [Solirubrobacteraceae bacterium]
TVAARGWPLRVARIALLLRRERFDVIEAYGTKASVAARLANALAGRPSSMIVGVQGLHLTEALDPKALKERVARAIERGGQRAVDAYDVNSLEAVDTLAACGVPASRVRYIPNGVDTDFWAPADTPITDRSPIVVCAARLVARKRQSDLIEAFAASGLASAGGRLFLVGDGPERPRVEQQVRDADLQEAVVVCGVLAHRELRELYDRAVVAVLPSSWEGMPASILEAQACGLPVIGSDVNGTRDVIATGTTGLLYEMGDIDALRDNLLRLIEDRPFATDVGVAARQAVMRNYSLDALLRSKIDLYNDVQAARGAPSGPRG